MKPSEYFHRQCFISIDPSEPYLPQLIEAIGCDNLIFGSDYPHMDHQPQAVQEVVNLNEQISEEIVRKILWDNPACFYGFGKVCIDNAL